MSTTSAPAADLESAFYWDALRDHRIDLQRCRSCGHTRFPAMPACPDCGSRDSAVETASGRGSVYSWVTVHVALTEAMRSEVPYTIGTVDLEEGCRVVARLELAGPPHAGDALVATYVDRDGWTELRFHGAEEPAGTASPTELAEVAR